MQAFVEQYGLGGFPHVEDDGAIFEAYGLTSQPGWAFIDGDGTGETYFGALGEDGLSDRLDALIAS
jgi:hypothetical protein